MNSYETNYTQSANKFSIGGCVSWMCLENDINIKLYTYVGNSNIFILLYDR